MYYFTQVKTVPNLGWRQTHKFSYWHCCRISNQRTEESVKQNAIVSLE